MVFWKVDPIPGDNFPYWRWHMYQIFRSQRVRFPSTSSYIKPSGNSASTWPYETTQTRNSDWAEVFGKLFTANIGVWGKIAQFFLGGRPKWKFVELPQYGTCSWYKGIVRGLRSRTSFLDGLIGLQLDIDDCEWGQVRFCLIIPENLYLR